MSNQQPIEVDTDGETYADIQVDGNPLVSVDLRDDSAKVGLYEADSPEDAIDVFLFDRRPSLNQE